MRLVIPVFSTLYSSGLLVASLAYWELYAHRDCELEDALVVQAMFLGSFCITIYLWLA